MHKHKLTDTQTCISPPQHTAHSTGTLNPIEVINFMKNFLQHDTDKFGE